MIVVEVTAPNTRKRASAIDHAPIAHPVMSEIVVNQENINQIGDAEVGHVTEIDHVTGRGHTEEVGHVIENKSGVAHAHIQGHH